MEKDEELIKKATKRAKGKTWFYIHFVCYLVVNIGMFAYWWTRTDLSGLIAIMSGTLFGWGIGVVAHFIGVFFGSSDK
jgi:DMSO/TMAO reductase YedYZ heme-binding membrane subunit